MRTPVPSSVTKGICNSREEESELRRGLKRTGKSCRLRWLNYLKPDIKRGNLTPQEQLLILELHSKWGNRWSKIAQHLPGRTDNEIKNYWRTRVQRQARQLNIESNSKRFLDAVRCYWMPRLLQKVEQNCNSSYPLSTLDSQTHVIASASSTNFTVDNSSSSESFPPQTKLAQYSNLASEHSSSVTSPSVLSTDSMPISRQPEFLENPAIISPPLLDNTVNNNLILSDGYYVENSGYHMDGFNPASMPEIGTFGDSTSECQMAEGNWVFDYDMTDTLWNMDDIWQFRL
ncbi:hypothetical protein GH714_019235 [Hevea brasiliensis]|uniref:Uncharacterized protein n=1 Tax=Hevea brasiliensis TaxID=3981 RepID=A0A6A6ND99_HEVBR|nr:hypothetical protein GH714_019235 [Hevea brasiliensis]